MIAVAVRLRGVFGCVSVLLSVADTPAAFLLRFASEPHRFAVTYRRSSGSIEHVLMRRNPSTLQFVLNVRTSHGILVCKGAADYLRRAAALAAFGHA